MTHAFANELRRILISQSNRITEPIKRGIQTIIRTPDADHEIILGIIIAYLWSLNIELRTDLV